MAPVVEGEAAFVAFFAVDADFVKGGAGFLVHPVARDRLAAAVFRK